MQSSIDHNFEEDFKGYSERREMLFSCSVPNEAKKSSRLCALCALLPLIPHVVMAKTRELIERPLLQRRDFIKVSLASGSITHITVSFGLCQSQPSIFPSFLGSILPNRVLSLR